MRTGDGMTQAGPYALVGDKVRPDPVPYEEGVLPGEDLPAEWWNYFLNLFTTNSDTAKDRIANLIAELTTVLASSGLTPNNTGPTTQVDAALKAKYWMGDNTRKSINLADGADINTLLVSGLYRADATAVNTPNANTYFIMHWQHPTSDSFAFQIARRMSQTANADLWIRSKNTTWGSWAKLWNADNDGAGSGLDADLLDGMQPTSVATPNTVLSRDVNGRTKVADGVDPADAVNRGQLNDIVPFVKVNNVLKTGHSGLQITQSQEETPDTNPGTDWYTKIVLLRNDAAGYRQEMAFAHNYDAIFFRRMVNGVYSKWRRFMIEEDLIDREYLEMVNKIISFKTDYSVPGSYSYTPKPGTTHIAVVMRGAGGGSGNGYASTAGAQVASGGGGGPAQVAFLMLAPVSPVAIVVGAGGAGGSAFTSASNGSAGGTTSFGTLSLSGGAGSAGLSRTTSGFVSSNGANGGSVGGSYPSGVRIKLTESNGGKGGNGSQVAGVAAGGAGGGIFHDSLLNIKSIKAPESTYDSKIIIPDDTIARGGGGVGLAHGSSPNPAPGNAGCDGLVTIYEFRNGVKV